MNEIIDYIKKYRESNPSGWRRWTIGVLVALLALIVGVVLAFRAVQHEKQIAELKYERDLLVHEATQAEVEAKLSSSKEEQAHHEQVATEALRQVGVIEEQIAHIEDQHTANQNVINSIHSWDDVDNKVRK